MNSDEALWRWLQKLLWRWPLSQDEQNLLLGVPGRIEEVARRRDFVRLNEQTGDVNLVISGLVGQFGQTRDGTRQLLGLKLPGEMADLRSVILPRASVALSAISPVRVFRIRHDAILDLLRASPRLAVAFWGDSSLDAAVTEQWMINIARRNARRRIGHLFCELALRYEELGCERLAYPLPMLQVDMAEALALTSVHLNRTLRELREAGVVQLSGGVVHIADWQALVSLADFNPSYLHRPSRSDRPFA